MVQNFKGTVRLSEENYKKLVTTGTLTLNDGTVLTYDPIGTIYMTPDSEETAQASDLPTIYDLEAIDADYTYTIVKLEDGTQAIYIEGDDTYEGGINIVGELLSNNTQALRITEQEIV